MATRATDAAATFRPDIELHLGERAIAQLEEWALARGLEPHEWVTQPDLAMVGTTQAALAIRDELAAGGATKEAAILNAAIRIGIEPDALAYRLKQCRRYAERSRGEKSYPVPATDPDYHSAA